MVIDIRPEAQEELTRQAAAHGVQPEDYAAALLEDAVQKAATVKPLSGEQLDRTLQELAQFSHKIPFLPEEAFTRESLYRDHD